MPVCNVLGCSYGLCLFGFERIAVSFEMKTFLHEKWEHLILTGCNKKLLSVECASSDLNPGLSPSPQTTLLHYCIAFRGKRFGVLT